MALLNKKGTFRAQPLAQGLTIKDNGTIELAIKFLAFQEAVDGSWVDCAQEEITGYAYPEKKDGSVNTAAMESLNKSFGCPLHDITWMQGRDLSQHPVQIVTDFETYNNKQRLKVKFVNPDGEPRQGGEVPQASEDTLKAIRNKLGGKLRAAFGAPASGTKPPPPPPAKPAQPRPVPPQPPMNATEAPPETSEDDGSSIPF